MDQQYTKAKITLTGLAGTGKSRTGKELKDALNLKDVLSAGGFVRKMVNSGEWRLQSLEEFEERAMKDFRYDSEIDSRTTNFGCDNESFVFDGRMAWSCVPKSIKILLTCEDAVRFARVANHMGISFDEAKAQTIHREASIRVRFNRWYGFEQFDDPRHFDLCINTTAVLPSLVVRRIVQYVSERGIIIVSRQSLRACP